MTAQSPKASYPFIRPPWREPVNGMSDISGDKHPLPPPASRTSSAISVSRKTMATNKGERQQKVDMTACNWLWGRNRKHCFVIEREWALGMWKFLLKPTGMDSTILPHYTQLPAQPVLNLLMSSMNACPTDDGVDLRNVWEKQQLYSILYRSVNGLFVIWDALVGLIFNKVCNHESAQ